MKVWVIPFHLQKFFVIIKLGKPSRSKHQPEVASLLARRVFEKPKQHRPQRRHSRSGADENRVANRLPRHKVSVRPVKGHTRAFAHVAEIVGEESELYAVQANIEGIIRPRLGNDRIGAGDFAALLLCLHRDKLPRDEVEPRHFLYLEFQMLGSLGKRQGLPQSCREQFMAAHRFLSNSTFLTLASCSPIQAPRLPTAIFYHSPGIVPFF